MFGVVRMQLVFASTSSQRFVKNPEFHDLMRMDKSHWPGCRLWHGWLPSLSGVNRNSPWAATAVEGAGNLLESCRVFSVRSELSWQVLGFGGLTFVD